MNKNGFTLVELLIAAALTGLMVIGITSLFIAIDATQIRTRRLESATRTAEAKIESLRNNHYNSLTPGSTIDFTSELPPELPEPRSATVDITEPEPGMRRLEVTITYDQNPSGKTVKLTAQIGTIGIAQ